MRLRYRRTTIEAPGGHTWRDVPLTDYEANLLSQLAGQEPNVGTWRATLFTGIAERFHGGNARHRVML